MLINAHYVSELFDAMETEIGFFIIHNCGNINILNQYVEETLLGIEFATTFPLFS